MSNNGKSLTNVSFRAKMLEVIDKLKDQDKTALVRHVDDFEALNKDTFEAGMNALVEAIPEGGGGGGGTGDGGYVVTFGMDFQNEGITCDKTIEDIIAHANKHIVGRFVIKDFPMDGVPATIDLYCDNLKFDYQQLKSDDPQIAPMIPTYTYLGFSGDGIIFSAVQGEPLGNEPVDDGETLYYKVCVMVYYMFDDETPHWEFDIRDVGGGSSPTEIETTNINFVYDDKTAPFTDKWKVVILSSPDSYGGNAETYLMNSDGSSGARGEQFLLNYFMPPNLKNNEQRTALYSPYVNGAHGTQLKMYSKAAQVELFLDGNNLWPDGFYFDAIFTINRCSVRSNSTSGNDVVGGYVDMFCDEVDDTNSRIIRHFIRIEVVPDSPSPRCHPKTTYKKIFIPYTTP